MKKGLMKRVALLTLPILLLSLVSVSYALDIISTVRVISVGPPLITIISPTNGTVYGKILVPLTFAVNESASWIGYSLNGGGNVTISGNTSLAGLTDGSHSLLLFANNTYSKMGFSAASFYYCLADSNADGIIGIEDIALFSKAYGSIPSSPNWNSSVDFNNNFIIDIFDLFILGRNYGKNCNLNLTVGESTPVTRMYVEPEITSMIEESNKTFTVNISVEQVSSLYAFEFKMKFNPKVLNVTSITDSFLNRPVWVGTKSFDNTKGEITFSISSWIGAMPKTGKGALATITFLVKDLGKSNFDMFGSKLIDYQIALIGHNTTDGSFSNKLSAIVDVKPDVLNLKDRGKSVTTYITLANGSVQNINISTVKLWYGTNFVPAQNGEIKENILIVKFDRTVLTKLLTPSNSVELIVNGEMLYNNRTVDFEGIDAIRIMDK